MRKKQSSKKTHDRHQFRKPHPTKTTPLLGFSTGCFWKLNKRTVSNRIAERISNMECSAIEIICAQRQNIDELSNLNPLILNRFKYVSLHLPHLNTTYSDSPQTATFLSEVLSYHQKLHFDLIVLHPDLVECWDLFREFRSVPLAIENQDIKKHSFQRVPDFHRTIEKFPFLSLVLDLQHIFTLDPTLSLADTFFDTFGSRIKEIHLSGYHYHYNHHCLFKMKTQDNLTDYAFSKNLPVIIESIMRKRTDAEREMQYVSLHL